MSINVPEKEIIVILPGLQYEKYGILTVDKIEISATINNIPVQVYYLDTEENTEEPIKNTETLTLCKTTEGVPIEGLYNNIKYLGAIQEDLELRRAKTGSFFEIKGDNNTYTISIFNKNLQYKNQSDTLHDGLCFVKIFNMNANISFKVHFYSLLKYKEQDNTNVDNFTLVDTKTYYYNPLLNDLNLSVVKATPIQLKFSPSSNDDKQINIKLSDNAIVYNNSSDNNKDYVRYTWNGSEYMKSNQYFNNSDLTLCAWPQAFIHNSYFNWNTNKFKYKSQSTAVKSEPGRVVYCADPWCSAVFPLYYKDYSAWTEKYKLQQDWFKKRTNVLGLTVDQLHDYGIYQTNFFSNIDWHHLTRTHDNGIYEYMYGEDGVCAIENCNGRDSGWVYNVGGQEYVQGVPKEYMVYVIENADGHGEFMDMRRRIDEGTGGTADKFTLFLLNNGSKPVTAQSKYFQYKMLVPDLQDTNNPLNVALQSEYTHYQFLPSGGNKFDYLYKKSPYICLHNLAELDPIQAKDEGLLKYFYHTTKNNSFQSPQNFIGAGSSRIIDLNDSNKISWQWNIGNTICKSYKDSIIKDPNDISRDYRQIFNEKNPSYINKMLNTPIYHTFPNFVLAVNLDESNLTFKNLSDYKVVPQVAIKHNNNPVGLYEKALVESNVEDYNYLDLSTITTSSQSNGFFSFNSIMHFGHNNTLSWSDVEVPDSGYYVFSINGFKRKSYTSGDYNTKIQLSINDQQYIIDINKDMHFLVFYLVKDTKYNISLSVIDKSYYNMLYLSSVGLYKLNLDNDNVYNTYFKQSTQNIDTTTMQYIEYKDDLYKCIIFQGVYVYQEYQAKCYNIESNAIYPPEQSYQKPIGVYQVDNNNTKISKHVHNSFKLLGYKGSSYNNSDCDKLIETITVKQ